MSYPDFTPQSKTLSRPAESLQKEIIDGLISENKYISSRFFYDKSGSALFNQITELDEYYPTRTEISILTSYRDQLAGLLLNKSVVELGSGDARKISILIDAIEPDKHHQIAYFPVDVSSSALNRTAYEMKMKFPELKVNGIVADFVHHIEEINVPGPRVVIFFGSTLGNFEETYAVQLLRNIRSLMSGDDILILGLDRVKDPKVLWRAYNDDKGVTAKFNLNILKHINAIIDSNFITDNFRHKAVYNSDQERIEMYVVAKREQLITSPYFDAPLLIRADEEIHTENSHKYSKLCIQNLIEQAGFRLAVEFTDEKGWFSLLQLELE